MAILEVEHIQKSFGSTDVLKDISFSMERGQVLSIIGSSGSGKTTLLRCLNFLETAESGTIQVDGKILFDGEKHKRLSDAEIRQNRLHFGLVFQNFNLFPQYTALQNVTLASQLLAKEQPDFKANKARILADIEAHGKELLAQMGLADRAGHYPHQLSGGQQQRVAIARALVKMPKVLLLDEPLSNLDARLRLQTREEIRRIQKETGITTVFVTHDQEEAMSISDRIVVMQAGVVQQIGKPQQVYDDPVNLFVAKFLGTPPINMFRGKVEKETLYIGDDAVLSVPGAPDGEVEVGIRPEGFLPDNDGPLRCCLRNVEVMGRDVSIVAENDALEAPTLRAIVQSDLSLPAGGTVRFGLKPHKVLLFAKDTGERIRFGEARNG